MALIKCPECGKEISDKATSCPNCGYSVDKKSVKESRDPLISMVMGVISIPLSGALLLGFILAISSIILGTYCIEKRIEPKSLSIIGIVFSCISILISLSLFVLF